MNKKWLQKSIVFIDKIRSNPDKFEKAYRILRIIACDEF